MSGELFAVVAVAFAVAATYVERHASEDHREGNFADMLGEVLHILIIGVSVVLPAAFATYAIVQFLLHG